MIIKIRTDLFLISFFSLSLSFFLFKSQMSAPPKRPPSIIAPSFTSDVTFSTLTKPFELQLSHLGKTKSSSFSIKSETSVALPPIKTTDSSGSIDEPTDQEESKLKKTLNRVKSIAKSAFLKYWFLLGLVIAILLAWQFPNVGRKGGYIRAEWSIKWGKLPFCACLDVHVKQTLFFLFDLGAVVVIFLISGLSLRTRILAQTLLRVRLHLLIQTINLIMIPFFVFGLILLFFKLHMPVNSLLLIGVVIAASTPTTVSSNVVMTKNANGNEASGTYCIALVRLDASSNYTFNSNSTDECCIRQCSWYVMMC